VTEPCDDEMRSPLTRLAQGAAELHEMYTAFKDAGFTEDQALELVKTVIWKGN